MKNDFTPTDIYRPGEQKPSSSAPKTKSAKPPCCLNCGKPLGAGRPDRKFCSRTCKNNYHNKETNLYRTARARTVTRIQKNYDVLSSILAMGITSISRTQALQMGMDFIHMTSCCISNGRVECGCFDIKYRLTETKLCNISKSLTKFAQ